MIHKILGSLDLVAAMVFYLAESFNLFATKTILIIGIYILVKGILFVITMDLASILDIFSGIIIILSTFITLHSLIIFLVAFFLIQKGLFSLLN